ncbi:MAG: GntR family transcriptional regulator [Pseudolabrys sp.]|jgi:DNA-binding GntR family transcriptional regulator
MIVKSSEGRVSGLISKVETAGERVYRRLRNDIIFGRLAPAQKLKLEALKDSYGISISTLRELLNRLTSEGLIVAESARGFEVAPVSAENFRELANLRLLLESHALRRSFALGDIDWEGRVVAAHHKLAMMEKRTLAGDRRGLEVLKRYDSEFHQSLLSACGSRVLLDCHAAVFDKYVRYLMIAIVFRSAASAEHQKLLECALNRDAKTAQSLLATHITDCVSYTLANAPENLLGPNPAHLAAGRKSGDRVLVA